MITRYRFLLISTVSIGISFLSPNLIKADRQAGLVAHWAFDESSGAVANDSSGNNNTATLSNGPTWVAGKIANALNFDAVDDYATVRDIAILNPAKITIAGWISTRVNTTAQRVVDRDNGGAITYFLALTGNPNKVSFRVGSSVVTGTTTVSANTWHHIAGVYDGSTLTCYLDGVANGSVSGSPVLTDNGVPINIGRRAAGGVKLNGQLDDIRIYDRALSASEITDLYSLGNSPPPPPAPAPPPVPPPPVTIAVAQLVITDGDVTGNLNKVGKYAQQAAAGGARLLVLPELIDVGFGPIVRAPTGGELARPIPGSTSNALSSIAKQNNIWLSAAILEEVPDGAYDTNVLISNTGELISKQRKAFVLPEFGGVKVYQGNYQDAIVVSTPWEESAS